LLDYDPYSAPRPELRWRRQTDVGACLATVARPHPLSAAQTVSDPCAVDPERVVEYPSWDLPDGLVEDVEEAAQRVEAEGVEYLEPGAVEDGRGSRVSCLSCGRLGACAGPHSRRSSISPR
jgi:hypothetical protein